MQRVVHGAVPRVDPEDAPRELGQVGLAYDDRAGVERSLDDGRMSGGNMVAVDARAVRRPDPGGVDQVLDEQRAPREGPVGGAEQRLVEARDRGVGGVGERFQPVVRASTAHAGPSATHSTSILAPGITSAEISTRVEAGRVSPNTSCRTGLTSGRSFTSVR